MDGPARPQAAPHPKSKRSRRRNRHRNAQRRAEEARRAAEAARLKAEAARRLVIQREIAYFNAWPESDYPGHRLPESLGLFEVEEDGRVAERQKIWLRSFERWQRFRERFFRFNEHRKARSLDERILIKGTADEYLDMRFWECRRCGFNANDDRVWKWWIGRLCLEQRMGFLRDSQQMGVRFAHRRSWQRFGMARKAA